MIRIILTCLHFDRLRTVRQMVKSGGWFVLIYLVVDGRDLDHPLCLGDCSFATS